MRYYKRKILVTSVGTGVGNAIITALRKSSHHYNCIGLNTEPFHSGVFRSDNAYIIPQSAVSPREWLKRLLEVIEIEKPQLVIPAKDADINVLSSHIIEVEQLGTKVVCADTDIANACNDKLLSATFFKKLGLQYAHTVEASIAENVQKIIAKCGFPLIIKPRFGTGTIGVKLAFTEENLLSYTNAAKPGQYVIQEYIPPSGPLHSVTAMTELIQDQEYSLQLNFGATGNLLGWFASINTLENGLPVAVRSVRSQEVKKCISAITKNSKKMIGPFNFQGRYKNGAIIFFEANCRFTGITGTRAGMGFNEIDAIWKSFVEKKDLKMPEIPEGRNAFRNLEDTFFSKEELESLIYNRHKLQ